jgi:thiol-disulfide isomerase/thioredoxin
MRISKILTAALLCLPCWVGAASVGGVIRNGSAGEPIQLVVPQGYLNGKTNRFAGELDANGRFRIAVKITEPQIVFVDYNESRLAIFLADADTLQIISDKFQFPLKTTFGAQAGANNTVLFQYLQENPADYNEFNNLRFKVGRWWFNVEEPMNALMEQLDQAAFMEHMDRRKLAGLALIDDFAGKNPGTMTATFMDFLATEVIYDWAYHLTFYGQVYGGRHSVEPSFFEFLYEAPMMANLVGSAWYQRFLLVYMARHQALRGGDEPYWSGQYGRAAEFLSGKPLAFFRSEIIQMAFSKERFQEILPLYRDFLEKNTLPIFDEKIEDLYQKMARMATGASAATFSATLRGGEAFRLDALRGKVVYLNFWASWCGACLRKMEFFDEFETELTQAGVEIVNVSIDEYADRWEAALAERPFKGLHARSFIGQGSDVAQLYGVEAVPQFFILDRRGNFADKPTSSQPNDIRQRLLEVAEGK